MTKPDELHKALVLALDAAMRHERERSEESAANANEKRAALESLYADALRDAERYRFLRDGNSVQIFEIHEKWTSSHRLDQVINAAMEKNNAQG